MNKNIAISIIVLLLILSGGIFFMNGKTKNLSETKDKTTKVESAKSLKDLLSIGITQKCTFETGTIYLSGGKVRADLTENSHMIIDGKVSYVWTDNDKNGFKMNSEPSTEDSLKTNSSYPKGVDYNQAYNYNCSTWSLDSSVFDLPKDVKFQDINSLVPANQCSYCDGLDGESKYQCLKALNCN